MCPVPGLIVCEHAGHVYAFTASKGWTRRTSKPSSSHGSDGTS
jgi:hypothetical protein